MPFKEEIPDIGKWLRARIDSLSRDFSGSYAERAVRYYTYHGQKFQFRGFEWQIQILNDMHPRQVIQKRSQVGLTTIMMLKVVLFLEQYAFIPYFYSSDDGVEMAIFPTSIYTLENDDKVREFSADRMRDLIKENPYLEGLLEEGTVDQIALKKFGRAGLYLGGRKTVSSVTTIPAQLVMADEWDRTFDADVGEQLESRLKASPMFRARTQRGMFIKFSTPELENWGVTKTYDEVSDQMSFLLKCTRSFHGKNVVIARSPEGRIALCDLAWLFYQANGTIYRHSDGAWIKNCTNWCILDHTGWVGLSRIMKHPAKEKMLSVKMESSHLLVTENHPFVISKDITRDKRCPKCGSASHYLRSTVAYKSFQCGSLECGYKWRIGSHAWHGSPASRKIIPAKDSRGHLAFRIRQAADLWAEFRMMKPPIPSGWLLGMVLTDGCLLRGSGKSGFNGFGVSQKAGEIADKLLREMLAARYSPRIDTDTEGHSHFRVFDSKVAEGILESGLGVGSEFKRLPVYIFSYPAQYSWDVIAGVIDGDGTVNDAGGCSIRVASYSLVQQIKIFLSVYGFNASVSALKKSGSTFCEKPLPMFSVNFTIRGRLAELLRGSIKVQRIGALNDGPTRAFDPGESEAVEEISICEDQPEEVYDVTTRSGFFFSNGILTHNCNDWQEMLFPDSIANFYEKGQQKRGEPFYHCLKCHRPLDFSQIGQWHREEPLKTLNCEWVPKKKEYYEAVTRYGDGYRGYKVPWAYSAPVEEVMNDRDTKTTLYFHHHVLGIPYQDKRSGLTSDVFKSISNPTLTFGYKPNHLHVMGVDQGCYIVIWRLIPFSRTDLVPIGKWELAHAEFCPDAVAFKAFEKTPTGLLVPKPGRLNTLMEQWKITLCVIDAEPSGNEAIGFQKDFLRRVWVNHSTKVNVDDQRIGFNWTEEDKEPNQEVIFIGTISEDKTLALDAYFDFLYSSNLVIPEHDDEIRRIIDHHLNVRKTTTEKKMAFGRIKYETIYYATGPDHFAQASKFAFQAANLYHKLSYLNPTALLASGEISGVKMFREIPQNLQKLR